MFLSIFHGSHGSDNPLSSRLLLEAAPRSSVFTKNDVTRGSDSEKNELSVPPHLRVTCPAGIFLSS